MEQNVNIGIFHRPNDAFALFFSRKIKVAVNSGSDHVKFRQHIIRDVQ